MLTDPVLGLLTASVVADLRTAVAAIGSDDRMTLRSTDLSPGGSKRIGSPVNTPTDKYTMTVSHSETKENSPYITNRSVVRLDLQRVDDAGVKVNLTAFMVIAQPLGDVFTDAEALEHARTLAGYLLFGEVNWSGTNFAFIGPVDGLPRILAGEP